MDQCGSCAYYVFDEEYDGYVCDVQMDEDDFFRLFEGGREHRGCPYYRSGDEYLVVRKQM